MQPPHVTVQIRKPFFLPSIGILSLDRGTYNTTFDGATLAKTTPLLSARIRFTMLHRKRLPKSKFSLRWERYALRCGNRSHHRATTVAALRSASAMEAGQNPPLCVIDN